jgi:hypothetical protein
MDLRSTNADEKLPVKPYGPQPSRDRKGAYVSPDFRLFFKGAVQYSSNSKRLFKWAATYFSWPRLPQPSDGVVTRQPAYHLAPRIALS